MYRGLTEFSELTEIVGKNRKNSIDFSVFGSCFGYFWISYKNL